jgi:hypothetical protein
VKRHDIAGFGGCRRSPRSCSPRQHWPSFVTATEDRNRDVQRLLAGLSDSFRLVSSAVADFVKLAQIPRDSVQGIEEFLRTQEADSTNTLAVLERPDQPVALLKVTHAGEATLFSVLPGQQRVHESYIGRVYDAVITQVHAIENAADASALKPERVEIEGSRLAGTIDLTSYTTEERSALMDALRKTIASR